MYKKQLFAFLFIVFSISGITECHNSVMIIKFRNNMHDLHMLRNLYPELETLRSLIDRSAIRINGVLIPKNETRAVAVVNNTCTVTISACLDYFDPLFKLEGMIKHVAPMMYCHLILATCEIHPQDIEYLNSDNGRYLDINNLIIDIIDKYNLLDPDTKPTYRTEFEFIRTVRVTIP